MNNRIYELRKEKNVSQTQLARLLGTTHKTISNYENGITKPNFNRVCIMANYFNVSTDYLMGKSNSILPIDPPEPFSESQELKFKVAHKIYKLNDKQVKTIDELINLFEK